MNKFSLLAAALLSTTALTAQGSLNLVTNPGFANNNQGSPGGGVYFDLTSDVGCDIISLALNLNAVAGTVGDVTVWVIRGQSFAGNETNMAAWTQVATASTDPVTGAAGIGMPTPMTLDMPITLNPGELTAVALAGDASIGHAYINGDGTNETVSAPGLLFEGGTASNVAFTGAIFSPRVANVDFEYVPAGVIPPQQTGVAELAMGAGTLDTADFAFTDGNFLRFGVGDPLNSWNGAPYALFLNFGFGGSNPTASNPLVNGNFVQRTTFSTPASPLDFVFGGVVGLTDTTLFVPPGIFMPGDEVRAQTVVFDATAPLLPVTASGNTVTATNVPVVTSTGFENGIPARWSLSGTNNWTVNSGGTTSGATGPTSAFAGSNYIYAETSGAAGGRTWVLKTEVYDSASFTPTNLDFALSRIGATIGTLDVLIDDGVNPPVSLMTYTGPDPSQAQGATEWSMESLPLGPLPATFCIIFSYTDGTSFTGDLAIDEISLN